MAMWRRMRVSPSLSSGAAGNLWTRFNTCELWCLLLLELSCAEDCKAYIITCECLLSCIEKKKTPQVIGTWHLTHELYKLFHQKAIFSRGTKPGGLRHQDAAGCVTTSETELTQLLDFTVIRRTKTEFITLSSSIERTVPSLSQLPLPPHFF